MHIKALLIFFFSINGQNEKFEAFEGNRAKEQRECLKIWPQQIYSVSHSVMSETITCSDQEFNEKESN